MPVNTKISPREALIQAAVSLFRKQGYAATGINEIVQRSGAPKGSLYHYFPGGKVEVAAEAVSAASKTVQETLEALARTSISPGVLVRRYIRLIVGWMAKSGYTDGSPVATTLLEMAPTSALIRERGRAAYDGWASVIAAKAQTCGMEAGRARRCARFAVHAIEGALIQCRVDQTAQPLYDAAEILADLFDGPNSV